MLLLLGIGCRLIPQATTTLSPILTEANTVTSPASALIPISTVAVDTPSLLPTLPPAEAEAMILSLLKDNGGCLFPCWWGVTPGKTTNETARNFLEKFVAVANANIFNENGSYIRWPIPNNDLLLDLSVSISYDPASPNLVQLIEVTTQVSRKLEGGGFETVWENPLNEQFLQAYTLSQVLSVYKQPKDVYIFANEGWQYFELVLDYSNQGFAIWFSAPLESLGDQYLGCMSKAFTRSYFWEPEFVHSWAEGVTGAEDKSEINSLNTNFRLLENATSIELNQFYNIYVNNNNTNCVETPKAFWPGP